MKSQQFNQQVGATPGYTLRLLLDTIPQDLTTCNHEGRGDAWFGSIKSASFGLRGHETVLQVKHILLEGPTDDEVPAVALGYRYSCKIFFGTYKK
jgi:hypothetical protein